MSGAADLGGLGLSPRLHHYRLRDAQHIAAASVAMVDLVVSWNFKHIVHYDKINGYHGINLLYGYRPIPIYSPKEVVDL